MVLTNEDKLVQPKEDKEAKSHTLADIQCFYIVLHPHSKPVYRISVLGRKYMPDIKAHEKFWVSIEQVEQNHHELN